MIAMDALPENEWEGFEQALATEDAKAVYQFLNQRVPDLKKRLMKACEDFAKDFLSKTGEIEIISERFQTSKPMPDPFPTPPRSSDSTSPAASSSDSAAVQDPHGDALRTDNWNSPRS